MKQIVTRSMNKGNIYIERVVDFALLFLCFLSIIMVALLRGGHGVKSIIGVQECSANSFSLLLAAQLIGFFVAGINFARHKDKLIGRDNSPEYDSKRKQKLLIFRIKTYDSFILLLCGRNRGGAIRDWRRHDNQPSDDRSWLFGRSIGCN